METQIKTKLKPQEQEAFPVEFYVQGEGILFSIMSNLAQPPAMCLNNEKKIFIGQTPLAFNEYLQYAIAMQMEKLENDPNADYQELPDDRGWGKKNMPAVNISLLDCAEYCNWVNPRVPYEYALELKKRMEAVDPDYAYRFPIPDNKEDWKGWPPPYYIDYSTSLFYEIPNAPGITMPEETEWEAVKGNIEDLAKEHGKEKYGHINSNKNMPYRQLEGHSVNGIDDGTDDPRNMAYDVYGNVNEMGPELKLVDDYDKEVELANKYYEVFPEWQDVVEPMFATWFKKHYNK